MMIIITLNWSPVLIVKKLSHIMTIAIMILMMMMVNRIGIIFIDLGLYGF